VRSAGGSPASDKLEIVDEPSALQQFQISREIIIAARRSSAHIGSVVLNGVIIRTDRSR